MKTKQVIEAARAFPNPTASRTGKKFRLKDVDPGDTGELKSEDKPRAKEALQTGVEALAELQDMLYAQDRWSVLLIFQAMDAAGKDGDDQARDVGRESAGLPGLVVQGADEPRISITTISGAA